MLTAIENHHAATHSAFGHPVNSYPVLAFLVMAVGIPVGSILASVEGVVLGPAILAVGMIFP